MSRLNSAPSRCSFFYTIVLQTWQNSVPRLNTHNPGPSQESRPQQLTTLLFPHFPHTQILVRSSLPVNSPQSLGSNGSGQTSEAWKSAWQQFWDSNWYQVKVDFKGKAGLIVVQVGIRSFCDASSWLFSCSQQLNNQVIYQQPNDDIRNYDSAMSHGCTSRDANFQVYHQTGDLAARQTD